MHRHSAARTPGGDDGHRRVQPEPRSEATSGQQQVLNLQQGVGNSITGQIVQRSPAVIRRAGDKLAFERGKELGEDESLADEVSELIESHRRIKQGRKDSLEFIKEARIETDDTISKSRSLRIRAEGSRTGVPPEIVKLRQARNEEATVGEHKKTLADYHDRVEADAGWRWDRLKGTLSGFPGISLVGEPASGKVEIVSDSKRTIYTVYFDNERFNAEPDADRQDQADNVFTKRGYSPTVKPKQFVKDDNGVHTRRFVTRAITIWHVAAMFGLNLKPKQSGGETDVEPAYVDEAKTTRLDAQLPRYTGDTFDGHSETFDLREAAAHVPPGEVDDSEFTTRYWRHLQGVPKPHRTVRSGAPEVRSSPGKRTGYQFALGYAEARGPKSRMGLNERASMQVRNGSGPNQPFLSTASAQIDPTGKRKKVIRANKGERFDTGAENQGIVKVDLAKAQKLGIKIVNQHADESNQHKIAWDRVYQPKDIEKLCKRASMAIEWRKDKKLAQYADELLPAEEELSSFEEADRKLILDGNSGEVLKRSHVKRSAPQELDEYIYSARKNREVLMDKIPISCVTEINLNKDEGKWPGLDEGIERGEWLDFTSELQGKLKAYLRGTESANVKDEKYDNIQAMYKRAEIDKAKEGGNRT
ncbi:hypothetical protein KM427_21045 [Nocardioides sp. LMS-CY]|uniref:hypothetical protein n=1 Tax=Nocardioides sp. (strain LMS-CY) TaxID=2840457 RepID=UPI001BFFF88D|nr:hypothetical protein [Nocardioides sp. LMS-CY]QWF21399.1 hypothetical protein KM427_21045 [Nocardioides sp. LMS-CY]